MDNLNQIILTPEQQLVVDKIETWMSDPLQPEFKLGGFAGTGKTTVIKFIIQLIRAKGKVVICSAFTGKAVNVLQRKGVLAQTLHSLLYDCEPLKGGGMEFHLKSFLVGDLIIVDEASMISTGLYTDLTSFDKKYLFVGDPGQLEPVGDNPNLMARPDFVLSKIHRQAESSPIISFATRIREGQPPTIQSIPGLTIRTKKIDSPEFLSVDQVICARNATRRTFNEKIRIYLKFPVGKVVVGDKLICLRNAPNFGVFNGSILFVESIKERTTVFSDVTVRNESGSIFVIPLWLEPFQRELEGNNFTVPKATVYCDFGYAITCHKSQGSEWDKVLVWDEWLPPKCWDMKRWRYTAITRAAKELIYNI